MRHVILYSGGEAAPSQPLLDALRAAHCTATACYWLPEAVNNEGVGDSTNDETGNEWPGGTAPLAVLFDLGGGIELTQLHEAAGRALRAWPTVPLVACRREGDARGPAYLPTSNGRYEAAQTAASKGAARFDDAVLKRLGFQAVAAGPAQLAAVLREVEDGGTEREAPADETFSAATPASLLLPERLSRGRLLAAFEMVASLHFATDQKGAAQAALAGLASLVSADRWTIYLIGETGRAGETLFDPIAVRGLTMSERQIPDNDWRLAIAGDAIALSGAHSAAARDALRSAETVCRREGKRRVLAVPLVAGERVACVLEVVREGERARRFSPAEVSLLSVLAIPLSAALSNSARVAEAERLSQTDDLTRLHNARYLRQYLTGELKRARRYGSRVTAIFLDMDDFKRVNDSHGHLAGSHVLVEAASLILDSVRDTDIVARYGGDEFVVILPETGIEQGLRVAERMRERISGYTFNGGRGLALSLTASFGVASFPDHAHSPQQLIACADTAMYEAKAAHKDCVRFAGAMREA